MPLAFASMLAILTDIRLPFAHEDKIFRSNISLHGNNSIKKMEISILYKSSNHLLPWRGFHPSGHAAPARARSCS